jgi:HEPN domain-containing protein
MNEIVAYWLETAEHDRETMAVLAKSGRYSDALFFGHIILEKALKALVVRKIGKHAPFTHDLVQLQKLSGIAISETETDLLDQVNDFNIRARYPERKMEFYKQCTKEFSEPYLTKIMELYQKLWQTAKS